VSSFYVPYSSGAYKTAFLAYVLNLRGDDIPFNPVFVSYLYIGLDRAILFIEQEKVENPVRSYLQNLNIEIRDYNSIWSFLRMREWGDGKVRNPPYLSFID
jgi:Xaa-Pro aminopeptidase